MSEDTKRTGAAELRLSEKIDLSKPTDDDLEALELLGHPNPAAFWDQLDDTGRLRVRICAEQLAGDRDTRKLSSYLRACAEADELSGETPRLLARVKR
jgi:hypothetical protein